MTVFGYVEHASAEVLGAVVRFIGEYLYDAVRRGILDSMERTHESTGG
jgi:hypothetical protein